MTKEPHEVTLCKKWSSVDQVLLPRGNLPDSQNICSDVAKIEIIYESSKFWSNEIK